MQFIILFILAVAWGAVLVPDLLKRRGSGGRGGSRLAGIGRRPVGLQRSLTALGSTQLPVGSRMAPRGSVVPFPGSRPAAPLHRAAVRRRGVGAPPATPADAARRRIYVLSVLLAASVLSLAISIAVFRPFLFIHFVVDLALALYVYMLFELRAQQRLDDELVDDEVYDDYESDDVAVGQA